MNASSANAVALAGVRALLSSNTITDPDPNATVWRNRIWLTSAFAAEVKAAAPIAGPGAQWQTWTAHHATLKVSTTLGGDEHPPDTATTAYRQVIATITPVGAHHWRDNTATRVVFVVLAHTTLGWRIAAENG